MKKFRIPIRIVLILLIIFGMAACGTEAVRPKDDAWRDNTAKEICYCADGGYYRFYKIEYYDRAGKLLKTEFYNSKNEEVASESGSDLEPSDAKVINYYDERGNCRKTEKYNAKGTLAEADLIRYYDSGKVRLCTNKVYAYNGELMERDCWYYDENENLEKIEYYDGSGFLLKARFYDENGNERYEDYYADGKLCIVSYHDKNGNEWNEHYDENGNLTSITYY